MSTILVTGGACRTGKAISLKLAEEGYDLIIHYHTSGQEAETTAAQCRQKGVSATLLQGDLSLEEGIKEMVSDLTPLHGLVNNVGNYTRETALEASPAVWRSLFAVNLLAPVILTQELTFLAGGAIVNIGHSGLLSTARSETAAYLATKMALFSFTRSLALELAAKKVRVNMVSPGQLENSVDYDAKKRAHLPFGRAGSADEVADAVCFLMGEKSQYITGQNIDIAGGNRL